MHVLARICTLASLAGLCSASLPAIPFLGDNMEKYQYVYWIIIFYGFMVIYFVNLRFLLPLLEELRLVIEMTKKDDPSNLTPEERGPVMKESLWIGLTHFLLSFFHFLIVIAGNTFEESPIGVSTLIGNAVLNNFLQLGLILLISKQVMYVNSWMAVRDAVIVCLASIMFIALVFFEESFVMGIFFWVILLIYWVLEVLSKFISQKLKHFLSTKNESQFSHLEDLRNTKRDRISYAFLMPNMPKKDDQEYVKIIKRFRELHEDTKSTAVKARMEIKKRLFIMIMSVIVAIRKLKYGHKNQMKAERSKAYLMDKRSLTKEDIVTEAKSYVRDKGMGDDSFEKAQEEEKEKLNANEDEKEERERSLRHLGGRVGNSIGKMLAGKDSDEVKVEVVEIYKGHFYSVNKKICTVLFIILMPFSLLFTVTLPNPEKKRTDRRHLYWGLSIAGFYIFLFSAIIIWMEDGLFIHFKYPAPLLGFALNAPLITGPHLLHNLATLNPDRPLFNFFSYFQQLTIFRFCCVLGVTWIFDIIFKSGAGVFSGNTKSIIMGLLVLLCFELVSITIVYLNRWRVPKKATWTLIGLGSFLYLGIIGIGFLD